MYIDIVQLRCEILLMFNSKALLNKPYSRNTEIFDNSILDSSFGSALAWYQVGPGFKSWQGRVYFRQTFKVENHTLKGLKKLLR